MDVLTIADDWSFWSREVPSSVPRNLTLPEELDPALALVIQGVRRCGKSTLLSQLPRRYDLDLGRCLFINFEDPRLSNRLTWETLQELVDAMESAHGSGCAFFLDEIQHVEGWQRWLRSQLDRPRDRRFVVTGSNAHLLSGELGSSLTGRHLTAELFPYSLDEFRTARKAARRRAGLDTYLEQGGFPAPLGSKDGDALRRTYFTDIVERDVRERVGARSSRPLRQLAQMLFEGAGSETSLRRLAGAIGVSADTASLYVEAIESAYLVFSCPFFAYSERKRQVRNRKYYPIDTGLRRACITRTGEDRGRSLECAVFLALRRHFGQVAYWRGRGEVDFVVEGGGRPVPLQVSWDGPTDRGEAALEEFYEAFPQAADPVWVDAERFERGDWLPDSRS